jgi:hypothetical protein
LIGLGIQPVRVDIGQVRCIGGFQRHISSRRRGNEDSQDRCILIPVFGLVDQEVGEVAYVACAGDILHPAM